MSGFKQWMACLALSAGMVAQAQAYALAADGQWNEFDVDDYYGQQWVDLNGDALNFDFTIGAGQTGILTVVDGGFAGDSFQVFNGASLLGGTSTPTDSYPDSVGLDFDAALADADYSRGVFTLGAGDYSITGLAALLPLGATVGAVKLDIANVPEPQSLALLLAGFAALGFTARRRA